MKLILKSKALRFISFQIIALLITTEVSAYSTPVSLWVGETYTCEVDESFYAMTYNWSWNNPGFSMTGGRQNARTIKATSYFNGTQTVVCTYNYKQFSWDTQLQSGRKEWAVTCKSNPLVVSTTSMSLSPGQSGYIGCGVTYSNDYSSGAQYSFTGYDTSIISVSSNGQVTAKSPGTTTVTVGCNLSANYGTCRVTVQKVDPTSVSIPSTLTAYVGESTTCNYDLYPTNAQTTLTWYSRNTDKATVTNGTVYGVDEGTAYIYCTTSNGLQSNDCQVTVKYRTPTKINMSDATAYIPIGQTKQLNGTVTPSNAKYTLTWKSSDETVATVDQNGKVTAVSNGKARITVSTDNGFSDYCDVTVPPNATSVSLSLKRYSLWVRDKKTITVSALPEDAYFTGKWESSDPSVASVSQTGEVLAISQGTAIISYITDKGLSASATIVVPDNDLNLYVWGVNGEKYPFDMDKHTVCTYADGKLIFDVEGDKHTYDASGITKITLKEDGTQPIPSKIVIPRELEMNCGDHRELPYTLYPLDYDIETTVTWTSDDAGIAIVDKNGKVKALDAGETVIRATTSNGRTAECHLKVKYQECYYTVILRNGTKFGYDIAETPKLTYRDGYLVFTTKSSEKEYKVDDVWKICLVDTEDIAYVGDVNGDGMVDISDVSALIQKFIDKKNSATDDVNGDGIVDLKDIKSLADKILNK